MSTNRPDVSVLIVNYNVKDYLLQCLRSVMASEGIVTYEIVVVDNASSDNSVAELQPEFPNVVWMPLSENVGFGRGNNAGLDVCKGRYVLFLNPDTIIAQDTLATMVAYLDGHPDVGLAGCKVLNADGTFQVACRRGLPTPWASFCKLFGLQALFPSSPLFAQYNLTYRSVDATYDVDALIGAFMIGPLDLIKDLGGFDPAFFMYGEDLDLCYRVQKSGQAVRYVHDTSIIHFKGESTKRSSMNEVRVFYQAMEIFARKHFGRSRLFLFFMRLGIALRGLLERLLRRRKEIAIMVIDLLCVLGALLAATSVRFDGPFGFPDYAYPMVLVVVPLIVLLSLVSVGEYVEYRPSVRRSITGLLVSFFFLSSLTYFFKEYAFSRGVVLMTIGFSAVLLSVVRGLVAFYDLTKGANKTRRILVVGITESARRIIEHLRSADRRNAEIVGIVSVGPYRVSEVDQIPVLGSSDFLEKIVTSTKADEVIIADKQVTQAQAMQHMMQNARHGVRFHLASEYDDIVTARIINDVAGVEPTVAIPRLYRFRNRVAKRLLDIVVASIVVPLAAISVVLPKTSVRTRLSKWVDVLAGKRSLVGTYPDVGMTGLAHISHPETLSPHAIAQLNAFYVEQY
ncbi:MAG: glycosyltransferase, partial [Ignavibacteriae bacterium]